MLINSNNNDFFNHHSTFFSYFTIQQLLFLIYFSFYPIKIPSHSCINLALIYGRTKKTTLSY